jgi:nitric oxide reductase large subunit
MTDEGILAGKAGFQKADLMDYGSLYGMGSYFGQDYTAFGLMRVAKLTEENLITGSRYSPLPGQAAPGAEPLRPSACEGRP